MEGARCAEGLVDAAGICEQLGIPHHVVDTRNTFQQEIVQRLVDGYRDGITAIALLPVQPLGEVRTDARVGHQGTDSPESPQAITPGSAIAVHRAGINCCADSTAAKTRAISSTTCPRTCWDASFSRWANSPKPTPDWKRHGTACARPKNRKLVDLCLADHHGSMRAFLDAYLPPRQGEIVLNDGTVVGEHDGIEHFTIGQRKGLGVAWREPLHVIRLDPAMNRVVVAPRAEAGRRSCVVGAINWVSMARPDSHWRWRFRCATAVNRWRRNSHQSPSTRG